MKVVALVENHTNCELRAKHGLSLYIETKNHKILFDVGPDDTLFQNSKKLGIDLTAVDTVIISHGHCDHGGAMRQFLHINKKAKIYIQRKALEKHLSKFLFIKFDVGIAPEISDRSQVVMLDGSYIIDDELALFTVDNTGGFYSSANDALYTATGKDDFSHEQNLIISADKSLLITGCGHAGIVNILKEAERFSPSVCVGGYHLFNPLTKKTVSKELLDGIAQELSKYDIQYYTCHCTGKKAFQYLSKKLPRLNYLSCGDEIKI